LEYQRISAEVAAFKTNVLNLYRQHIESLSTLPGHEDEVPAEKEEEPVQSPVEPAVPAAQEPAAAEMDEPGQPAQQETSPWTAVSGVSETQDEEEDFGAEIDFTNLMDAPAAPEEEPAEEEPSVFDGFQGIKFSD